MTTSPAKKRLLLALLALLAVSVVGCAEQAPQDFVQYQQGPGAEEQDDLWDLTFGIATVIFVIVEALLVFTLIRFRRRPGREAAQFHGNTKLEVILTVIPSLILAGVAVPTVRTIFGQSESPPDALHVKVVARQFWWEFQYPELGITTANEAHIPTGRPVTFELLGATDDVVHSFWIPRLGGSQDVIPGRQTRVIYEATEPGVFWGQCKEFCGLSHANMRIRVIADEPAAFETWAREQAEPAEAPTAALAQRGREVFVQSACAGCHTIAGTQALGILGPNLTHFASRETFAGAMFLNNAENLRGWVADAPAMKPGVRMPAGIRDLGLTQEEVDAIVAYLLTLE